MHTEAYDLDGTKQRQIEQIHALLAAETLPWVVGGDFNELPPVAARREDFSDERTAPVCGADFEPLGSEWGPLGSKPATR